MAEGRSSVTDTARKLLFELQGLLVVAEKAGIDTSACKDNLRKGSIASRSATAEGIKEMVHYLNEGRIALQKDVMEFFTGSLSGIRKEMDEKRESLPQGDVVNFSYTTAVNALNRKDYETALRHVQTCQGVLSKLKKTEKDASYGRYYARENTSCFTCGGKIKIGFLVIKCICGNTHHETCAMRQGACTCGVKFVSPGNLPQ